MCVCERERERERERLVCVWELEIFVSFEKFFLVCGFWAS